MTHKKTDILSDDQIDHGPASTDDMAWKERVTAYEAGPPCWKASLSVTRTTSSTEGSWKRLVVTQRH